MLKKLCILGLFYTSIAYAWTIDLDFRNANPIDIEKTSSSASFVLWIVNGFCLLTSFLLVLESGKRMKDQDFYGAFKTFCGAILIAISGRLAFKMLY